MLARYGKKLESLAVHSKWSVRGVHSQLYCVLPLLIEEEIQGVPDIVTNSKSVDRL